MVVVVEVISPMLHLIAVHKRNDSIPQAVPDKSSGIALTNVQMAVGGGPRLVKDGIISISYNEEVFWVQVLSLMIVARVQQFVRLHKIILLC